MKTEERYSANIYPWTDMSAQYPHYVSMKKTYIPREMLGGHSADIVRTYISRDVCPHYILLWFSTQAAVVSLLKCTEGGSEGVMEGLW